MSTLYEAEQRIRDLRHKKPSGMEIILRALQAAGDRGLTNSQIYTLSNALSWHRRVGDLRARGYDIESIKLSKGQFRYVLHDSH